MTYLSEPKMEKVLRICVGGFKNYCDFGVPCFGPQEVLFGQRSAGGAVFHLDGKVVSGDLHEKMKYHSIWW